MTRRYGRATPRQRMFLVRMFLAEKRRRVGDALTRRRGAAGPEPSGLRYVFIVTYGRSGSTLLQGILNSSPGVLIRGENGGVPMLLWRYHRRSTRHRHRLPNLGSLSPRHPWYGIDGYPEELAVELLRDLMLRTVMRPDPDTRVIGFKEIRWPVRESGLDDYVDFLRRLFPDARFVVNTRDLDATARSGWWARHPEAVQRLRAAHERMVRLCDRLGPAAYQVHYDEYRGNPDALRGLFEWLDLPFDRDRVAAVMTVKHSFGPNQQLGP